MSSVESGGERREKIVLPNLNFVGVFETIMQIARDGKVDLSNPGFLREVVNAQTWGTLDEIGRDPKHLHRLIPPLNVVQEAGLRAGLSKEIIAPLYSDAVASERLDEASLGKIGYTWLARRQTASQLIYALGCEIQGDFIGADADERHARAENFLLEFYQYGLDNTDSELQKEVEQYERQLGVLFCMRAVAVLTEHPELNLTELVRHGLGKYGVKDVSGKTRCYWCPGRLCVCGGRKGDIKAKLPDITDELALAGTLRQMDEHMTVYGVGRNSAIDGLAGVVRSLSEDGGEFGSVRLMSLSGGTLDGLKERLGCLYLEGTRQDKMAQKEEAAKVSLEERIYSEAADAMVSWPCLVTQAVGLNFERSVMLGLTHMAEMAGVELQVPEHMNLSVSAKKRVAVTLAERFVDF